VVSYDEDSDHTTQTSQPGVDCTETDVGCMHSFNASTVPCCAGEGSDDTLKIAWRYKNLHLPVIFCLIIFTLLHCLVHR